MDAETFDGLLRRAVEAIDRRRSLRLLGAGALGFAAAPASTPGASAAGKKAEKKCRRQRGQCLAFVQRRCAVSEAPARDPDGNGATADSECVAQFNPCCGFFAECQARAALECLAPRRPTPAD